MGGGAGLEPTSCSLQRVDGRVGHRAVLFGGLSGNQTLGDTWTFDGAAWTQLAASSPSPPARQEATMATLGDLVVCLAATTTTGTSSTTLGRSTERVGRR